MTTANKITILRILMIPFFIVQVLYYVSTGNEVHRWIAFLAFALAAICDGVDGYIARRYNQRSELGAILDPLADKLLLLSGVVLLSRNSGGYLDQLPIWLTATIISRDVLLTIGWLIIYHVCGKVRVHPHLIGKIATFLQMISVVWILLKWHSDLLQVWIVGAGVCTAVSGLIYVLDGMRQLSISPSSAASPEQK